MDVSFLAPVFAVPGPYATVCADVTHRTENADTELDLRVRAIAARLREQGAPEPVIEAVQGRLLEGNEGGPAGTLRGRAVVAVANGSVVLDEALIATPPREIVEWSAHPELLPVLRQLPSRVPHAVVIADRVGADIYVTGRNGESEQEIVEGATWRIHKVKVGGWAHDHWQNSVEEQWEDNAERVAEHMSSYVRRIGLQFVLIAGDVRARTLLAEQAGPWRDLVVTMDQGGRALGADREPIERREAELVAEHEAREIARVIEQVEGAGAHGLSVTGLDAVVEALCKSQVETLLLADRPDDESLFRGDTPLLLAVHKEDMDVLGAQDVEIVPADRALIAAAVASDAAVTLVPRSAMPGESSVAAVLRYPDAATPEPQ